MTFFSRERIGQESQRHWSVRSDGGHRYTEEGWLQKYSAEIDAMLPAGGTLVDVGCGACEVTVYLAQHYDRVIGVDFSEAMLNVARARVDKFGAKNIELMYGRAEKFPESLRRADTILSYCVVQYFDRDVLRAHLNECSRVLSPSGVICIANVPDAKRKGLYYRRLTAGRYRWLKRVRVWLYLTKMIVSARLTKDFLWDGIGNWFTKRQLSEAANQAGFDIQFNDLKFYEYRFHALLRRKAPGGA